MIIRANIEKVKELAESTNKVVIRCSECYFRKKKSYCDIMQPCSNLFKRKMIINKEKETVELELLSFCEKATRTFVARDGYGRCEICIARKNCNLKKYTKERCKRLRMEVLRKLE